MASCLQFKWPLSFNGLCRICFRLILILSCLILALIQFNFNWRHHVFNWNGFWAQMAGPHLTPILINSIQICLILTLVLFNFNWWAPAFNWNGVWAWMAGPHLTSFPIKVFQSLLAEKRRYKRKKNKCALFFCCNTLGWGWQSRKGWISPTAFLSCIQFVPSHIFALQKWNSSVRPTKMVHISKHNSFLEIMGVVLYLNPPCAVSESPRKYLNFFRDS